MCGYISRYIDRNNKSKVEEAGFSSFNWHGMRVVASNSSIMAAVNHYTKGKIAILPPLLQLLEVPAPD